MSTPARFRSLLCLLFLLFPLSALCALSGFYWDIPVPFSEGAARFPLVATRNGMAVVAWQESTPSGDRGVDVRISIAIRRGTGPWQLRRSVAGPYSYAGSEPSIASLALDARGRILLAVATSRHETDILISSDDGGSFSRTTLNGSSESSVAPRLFVRSDGGYLLFETRGGDDSLSIYVSRSDDGLSWSPFSRFVAGQGFKLNFLPTHVAAGKKDFVVFQSLSQALRPTFQLYFVSSSDAGATWSQPRLITSFSDTYYQTRTEGEYFDNQRAHLSLSGGSLFLVWERRHDTGSPQIYTVELLEDGSLRAPAERVTSAGAYCNNPIGFEYEGEPAILWFDNRRGQNRVYIAQREGLEWEDEELSGSRADASFARPLASADGLRIFWQSASNGTDRLFLLEPDRSVARPELSATSFTPGRRVRRDRADFVWKTPEDPSGIEGYAWLWSRDANAKPDRRLQLYSASSTIEQVATEDGSWYFSLIARDFAGNWSEPARLEFVRDTTPPSPPVIKQPELDVDGFLASNSFSLSWDPPPESDVAGYNWDLQYLEPIEILSRMADPASVAQAFPAAATVPREPVRETSASFVNRDNGVWRFVVSAIDSVGNVGSPAVLYFKADKYIPYTYVTLIDPQRDDQGVLSLKILGRGFTDGGRISKIYLDRDGKEPWDREFDLNRGEYQIRSDREIGNLRVEDLEAGRYRVGLLHPERGLHMTAPLVTVDEMGTVKFGDYSRNWEPSWAVAARRHFVFDSAWLLLAILVIFGALSLVVSARGIASVVRESAIVQLEVTALLTGDLMPSEKKARATTIRKRRISLRIKLAAFTNLLVAVVVIMVSVSLSILMTRTQERTLLEGLKDRSRVLLESLASGARAYLPSQNVLELGFLPAQTAAIPEAHYATITGFGSKATTFSDHIWATNDPNIDKKIDTASFQAGSSRIEDALTPRLVTISKELDDRARSEVGELSTAIADLTQEGLKLATRTDAEATSRMNEIQTTTRSLESRLSERLSSLSSEIGSEPNFSLDRLSDKTHTFIFFKPVMYRQGSEDTYFRGLIRLEVSTDSIYAKLAEARRALIKITLIIALIALALGFLGAQLLSAIIVGPIKKLVAHVGVIRDTDNKADLAGKDIALKTKDEIATLADTINEMTHGLVKAAQASQDLTIGKEVQKMFIPLETDSMGRKLTCGRTDTKRADFFGYYEGAKGVSGDYFDYLQLDDTYFALIKCDVAGKGVPAALIMIEVATLFLNFFKSWKPTKEGLRIERVVYQINDFIETRGFKGRFAAFTLCLFNSQTGEVHFCNAGDNIVHWYDASAREMKRTVLPETPTAGVFPNDLIEMKGGYTVQTLKLEPGDKLLLYTDGIEEAKRRFRDSDFREVLCSEGNQPVDTPHGNHSVGQADEEMGYERVEAILSAVFAKERYELTKWHNPTPDEKLSFDFTRCEGTIEEAIMALVSVEKVFRMYRNPRMGEESRVLVDRKVDTFLKTHFDQYRSYCSHTKDHAELSEYLYYTHLGEDDQYDDLTILGLTKK